MVSADCAKAQPYPKDPVHYFVTGVYQGVFGRQPDPAGWMYWVGPNDNLAGLSQAMVSNYFMTAQEYCNYFGVPPANCILSSTTPTNPPTDAKFLTLLYQRALNRQPDPTGYNWWLPQIPTLTRATVVDDFIAPTTGIPPVQSEFDSKFGAFANSYCAGYSTPVSFTPPAVTIGQPASMTVIYANNACGGADMSSGQVIIGPNASSGCDFTWTYSTGGSFSVLSANQNCTTSGGNATVMPSPNQNQFSVTVNFTISSSSLGGLQTVSSFAFDNQQVGNGVPSNLGSITVAGNSPDFGVGTNPASIVSSTSGGTFSGAWTAAAVTITPINGFSSGVSLSFTNSSSWPAGLSVTALNEVNNTISFSITTTAATPSGTYYLSFNASGGGVSHAGSLPLTISTRSYGIQWDQRLIPSDANGNVYAYQASYLTGDSGSLQSTLVNPTIAGPGNYSYSPSGCTPTTGSTPCSVSSPPFSLPQQGYGTYTFTATIYLYQGGSDQPVYSRALNNSKTYNAPSIGSISPNYTVAGTSSVTITVNGASLGAPDLALSAYAGVSSVNVTTSNGGNSGISTSFTPTAFSMSYPTTGGTLTATLNTAGATAGTYNVSVTALGSTSNTVTFTVADPTPSIGTVVQVTPLYAGQQSYIAVYGANFGTSGTVQICTNPDGAGSCSIAADLTATTQAQYGIWNNGQINALLTAADTASGTYYVQIVSSTDASGQSFLEAPQQTTANQSNRKGTSITPNITGVSPTAILMGSTNKTLTITGTGFGSEPIVSLPPGVTVHSTQASTKAITISLDIGLTATIGFTQISVTASSISSNKAAFTIDGPNYMLVVADLIGYCSGCATTVSRLMQYQAMNFGNTVAGGIAVCEAPADSNTSSPACDGGVTQVYTACTNPITTLFDGTFYDRWGFLSDGNTPVGCGVDVTDPVMWLASSDPQQVTITFATINGYIRTNAVNIQGYVEPPPNPVPSGTRIN